MHVYMFFQNMWTDYIRRVPGILCQELQREFRFVLRSSYS